MNTSPLCQTFVSCSFTFFFMVSSSLTAADFPSVTHYSLDAKFSLTEHRVKVDATLSIRNSTAQSHTTLPFLLYRLLTVSRVRDRSGSELHFRQNVVQLRDEPTLQANEVVVDLPAALNAGDSLVMSVEYSGFMFGYPEVMAYVKDRIDENYALLRPDAYAYPILSEPSVAGTIAAIGTKFTYDVSATVPRGYRAACGGTLMTTRTDSASTTFEFRSKVRTWRIDLAVAKFAVLTNPADQLVVCYLSSDSAGAQRVSNASRDVIKFYSEVFGWPLNFKGYSIIEIPDGWGSQAGDYYFLQTSAAFRDSSRIPEVYHEIGHSWNAVSSGEVQRCRYFDEAFASFFEALAIRKFRGERAFQEDMEKSRTSFVKSAQVDREVFETPIAGYGSKELGRHSYTKGSWSLFVLSQVVGEEKFFSIMREMIAEFSTQPIDFKQFQNLCQKVSKRDLHVFFQDWIFGSESSKLLIDHSSIRDIVRRYR